MWPDYKGVTGSRDVGLTGQPGSGGESRPTQDFLLQNDLKARGKEDGT
jgi:hypothetical protein